MSKKPTEKISKEESLCGFSKEYIRKKFFDRELGKLLNEIQANQKVGDKELNELIAFLSTLRDEDKTILEKMMAVFPDAKLVDDSEVKPPSVEELMGGVSDKEWRQKADMAMDFITKTLDQLRQAVANKNKIPANYWLDTAIVFLSYQEILERDRVYKTQQYYARLTNIIDESGCSRLEAENRSKLTKEYADYKYITLLLERIDKFDMLCKKKDNDQKYGN